MGAKEDDDIKFTFTFYGLSCSYFRMVLLLGAIDEQSKEETFEGESVTHQLTATGLSWFLRSSRSRWANSWLKSKWTIKGFWCALRCSGYFFLPPYTTSLLYYHGSFFGLSSSFSLGVRSFELPLLQPFISKCGLSSSSDMRERASFEIWPSKAWAGRSVEPNLLHTTTSFAFLFRPPCLGWLKFRKTKVSSFYAATTAVLRHYECRVVL